MRQPAQLLNTLPAVQVAAAAEREHHIARLRRDGAIVVSSEALVHARLLRALIDVLMALVTASRAAL